MIINICSPVGLEPPLCPLGHSPVPTYFVFKRYMYHIIYYTYLCTYLCIPDMDFFPEINGRQTCKRRSQIQLPCLSI